MITISWLCTLALAAPVTGTTSPPSEVSNALRAEVSEEVQKRIADCGEDVAKLVKLAEELKGQGQREAAKAAFARVVELDADHEVARKGLGHHLYDGRWYESYSALSAHKRAEAKRMLEEHGLVRFKDEWVPQADLPFVRMGWVKNETGRYCSKRELERIALDKQRAEDGWSKQTDLVWVPPDEVDLWDKGLVKCGEDWLNVEEANAYHSAIGSWWTLPGERFVALTTLEFDQARWAAWWADQTYIDLQRLFGVHPPEKPRLVVLNSSAQYNNFAAGDQASGRGASENSGESSVHHAFFADVWLDNSVEPREFRGTGVGFWEPGNEQLANFGKFSVRWAAGQAYAEAIDPSWDMMSRFLTVEGAQYSAAEFWREKRIPRWLRYGACSYVERYFVDQNAGDDGDPLWARKWALDNLRQRGGLRALEQIFAMQINTNDPPGSERLLSEAGCVVAFILDGEVDEVRRAHLALKTALSQREDTKQAVAALEKALQAHEAELKAFAGM